MGAVVFVIADAIVVSVVVVPVVIVAAVKERAGVVGGVAVVVRAAWALVTAQEKMCLEMMVSPDW